MLIEDRFLAQSALQSTSRFLCGLQSCLVWTCRRRLLHIRRYREVRVTVHVALETRRKNLNAGIMEI